MSLHRRISALSLAAALALTAACDDDGTGSGSNDRGSLSFAYSGAISGSYSASGTYEEDASGSYETDEPFAIGIRYFDEPEGEDFIDVFSYRPTSGGRGDILDLYFEDLGAERVVSLNLQACLQQDGTVGEGCGIGFFAFNVFPDDATESDIWVTLSGTLLINEVSDTDIRGTFSGSLVNLGTNQVITVSNGSFDVPLVDENDLGQARITRGAALGQSARMQAALRLAKGLKQPQP